MQRSVALVIRQMCVRGGAGLQQGTERTHASTGGSQMERGATLDVLDAHVGPPLKEGLHTLLLARHYLCEQQIKINK